MPDHRKHRGPHPEDHQLFAERHWADLRRATRDLSWLLSRGYASTSALKLVGDRYRLEARQRLAVARCGCSQQAALRRQQHQVAAAELRNQQLWIDGYNLITSLEAALSGGVILQAQDGCYRDMASMHGSYRKVQETVPAIQLAGELLERWRTAGCRWLLDRPVSNSGRLSALLREIAAQRGWNWETELVLDPDTVLIHTEHLVASSDSQILDAAPRWFNLARAIIDQRVGDAWIVNLSE